MEHDEFEWFHGCLEGTQISKEAALAFENRLKADPADKEARASLLGYYSYGRTKTKSAARQFNQHILWVLENAPECGLGATPSLHISKTDYPQDYQHAKEILLRQCDRFRDNAEVLCDLGCWFSHQDPEIALELLRQSHTLSDKENKPRVAFWISQTLHKLGLDAKDLEHLRGAVSFMQEAAGNRGTNRRLDYNFWLAKMAFDSEQFELANDVCNEILCDQPKDNQGVHVAHTLLGRFAFRNGNLQQAAEHLVLAGQVGKSPRLSSYGPAMELAQDLLRSGEKAAVTKYLTDCKKFWESGRRKLAHWLRQIEDGQIPALEGDKL